jgi:gamma-glutamylcyclotransferase (GGCT)/AIG2-like uncharacterized protein YtfP
MNLFAYGTLMCEDIMEEVSGHCLSSTPGMLKDFSRRPVKGEHYPGLVPDRKGTVEGVVYLDLPDGAWGRLDRFEGQMYRRQVVQVELNDGTILPAATYVVRPRFRHQLTQSGWDVAEFLRNGKKHFQRYYRGYGSLG